MKKIYILFSAVLISTFTFGQQKMPTKLPRNSSSGSDKTNFIVKPFLPSFVQNKGQFNKYDESFNKTIDFIQPSFGCQMGNTIALFKNNSIQFVENIAKKENETEEIGKNEMPEREFETFRQSMTFLNSNPEAVFIADKQQQQYFSYPDPAIKNGTIKANGWKSLTIKNIYKGIDVVYSFKPEGGIKYSFIVHPGVVNVWDIIKIQWSGVDAIDKDKSGNLNINSENGIYSDEAPVCYYENDKNSKVHSEFIVHDKTVSFYIPDYDDSKTLIIDPWINNPNFTSFNSAYDIQHDPAGNIYVYGGASPFQLQKYTSLGVPIWTYNTAANGYYGDFTIDPTGANVFIIYGPWGDYCVKITSAASLVWSVGVGSGIETYRVFPNPANAQLTIMGMKFDSLSELRPVVFNIDEGTGAYSPFSFHPTCIAGEDRCMSVDANGDAFGIVFSTGVTTATTNLLWKVNSANVTTNSVQDGYLLYETQGSNTSSDYSGFNGTTVDACAIFTYDGITVKKWDKTTLALLGSATIPGGIAYRIAGLCTDSCGNVFVGGPDSIFEFDNNMVYVTAVSTNGNQVYDVNNGNVSGEILACGAGFFGSFTFPVCVNTITNDTTQIINISSCSSPAFLTPTATGSSYLWSTGATTYTISVTNAGTYWVHVTGAVSCASTFNVTDTFHVAFNQPPVVNLGPDTSICGNGPLTLNAQHAGDIYTWSTGASTQTISINTTGIYWVQVDSGGCTGTDTINVNFVTNPIVNLGPDTSICSGNNITLNAGNNGFNYQWSTGATTQTITVNSTGNYFVIVSLSSCTGTDTVHIAIVNPPVVNLGNDTSVCSGQQVTLNAGNPGDTYQWSTGATTQSITTSNAGTYWVNVSNTACTATDSMAITVVNSPTVNLGPDSTVCIGQTVTLSAGNNGYNYLWNTGATTQTITVNSSGSYWVYVNIGTCAGSDTFLLSTVNPPVVNLGNDTSVCTPLTVSLNAGNSGNSYLWSSGQTTQTIIASGSGTYWVLVNNGHCIAGDSIYVSIVQTPSVYIGPDTSICLGQSLTIDAGNTGDYYLWSSGATTQSITADSAGTYWVHVNNGNCKNADTTSLTVITPPTPDLGGDKIICGILTSISAGVTAPHYLWSNGDTTKTIVVDTPGGKYWLIASIGMCWKSDTANITFINDSDYWNPPNVFTPNGDGKNDYFIPGIVAQTNYDMKIFNRWGELMFETNNPFMHWDGKNKGSDVPEGCYYWLASYAMGCEPNQVIKDKGYVMLYRNQK